MRKANNKIIGGIVLLAIVLVAVGYAAITNVTLNIKGTAKSEANRNCPKIKRAKNANKTNRRNNRIE